LSDRDYPSFDTPLTFIDPVDTNRNVASALVEDRFNLFIKACQEYIKNPRITFFFPNDVKPWSLKKIRSEIQKQECLYIGIKLAKPDLIAENLYPQLRKATRSIWEACKRYDFTIYDSTFHIDEKNERIFIIIKAKSEPLSKTVVHMGPPVELKKNATEFLSKWSNDPKVVKKPYEKNGRLYVEIKRDYRKIKDFLKNQTKHLSMGKHLDDVIKRNYEIVELKDLLNENTKVFWTTYLDGKMSWDI
jgi:tRNA nucleotidyltransferase (CCA-adding enzyme)